MVNYPISLDNDASIPRADNNIVEIGDEIINDVRDGIFAIETEVGIGGSGNVGSIAARLGISIDANGAIKPSALTGLGLVTLPITNTQISATAGIIESKLTLDHATQNLYNLIQNNITNINTALSFISGPGSEILPHIAGTSYNHNMADINVSASPSQYFKNASGILRNNSNLYNLFNDINNDFNLHERADGTSIGTVAPTNYGHIASGIFLNSSLFSFIPQTVIDLQSFAQFLDNSNALLLGTRIENFYANGIPRSSQSSSLLIDGYGQQLVGNTLATTFLLNNGSNPTDSINNGDDIVQLFPAGNLIASNVFAAQFSLVRPGDILRVNYGNVLVSFIIKETNFNVDGYGNQNFIVRINGTNLSATTSASARIDRSLYNTNKYGVLSLASANNSFGALPSLTVGAPRGAEALGIGFDPNLIDQNHYNLYLIMYPTGNPSDGQFALPTIDVSGNQGITPGLYTIDSIILNVNNILRKTGFNNRFIAFQNNGNFGIMLADSYNNVSFSIISGIVNSSGQYDQTQTNIAFPKNIINVFDNRDALGLGPNAANLASPPYSVSYSSSTVAQLPTKIFVPLKRNTFNVNGIEREKINSYSQTVDAFGDGYWIATITSKSIVGGNRYQTTYTINQSLANVGLKPGKTLVVQSLGQGTQVDFGRFTIQNVQINECNCSPGQSNPNPQTLITVYDSVQSPTGISPFTSLFTGAIVAIYFTDDSISFNVEAATDNTSITGFKRHFEAYIDQNGHTFTHERGRFNLSGSNTVINGITFYNYSQFMFLNIYKISPKLRGYKYFPITKITFHINSYDATSGNFDGYLCNFNGTAYANIGSNISGKKGEIIRFYDETNIDYIDIIFDVNDTVSNFSNQNIDIQLFSSLRQDGDIFLLGTCQLNDNTKQLSYVKDERQFGNISEAQLTNSALDLINAGNKYLHQNGIIRGFDVVSTNNEKITINGGLGLVNGQFININNQLITIPQINELYSSSIYNINWALCINANQEMIALPLTDYDSSHGTPNAPNRVFVASNPITSNVYSIDATTFSNIINNRKDLTILYVVFSTSDGITTTLTINDVRKFVNDESSISPITWTSDNAQGNFRSLSAILNWLKYNPTFNNIVYLRGIFNITSTQDFSFHFRNSTNPPVKFIGDGAIINVNARQGFILENNISFENITFNYIYDPTSDVGYSSSNLVNTGGGLFYCNVSLSTFVQDITIKNCYFNSTLADRYSFINFEFKGFSLQAKNIHIRDNIFTSSQTTDIRAIISFISTTSGSSPSVSFMQSLINSSIENNICDKDQLIIISVARTLVSAKYLVQQPAIFCENVFINRNICGAIGFLTQNGVPTINIDRFNGLFIEKNNCKYIASLDGYGGYVEFGYSGTNYTTTLTGLVNINDNIVSWIHTGTTAAPVNVQNNNLTAWDTTFLLNYQDTLNSNIDGYNVAIILNSKLTSSNPGITNSINNNTTNAGSSYSGISLTTYGYVGFIICHESANILGNQCSGITTGGSNVGILFDGRNGLIQNNRLIAGASTIQAYISGSLAGNTFAIATNNFFDKINPDGSTHTTGINIPQFWIFEKNKNQSGNAIISLTSDEIQWTASNPAYVDDGGGLTVLPLDFGGSPPIISYDRYFAINDAGTTTQHYIYKSVNLHGRVPDGVLITGANIGAWMTQGALDFGGTNTITLRITADTNIPYVFNSSTGSVLDVQANASTAPAVNVTGTYNISGSGQETAIQAATQYIGAGPCSATVDKSYLIKASLEVAYKRASATVTFGLSPIVINYQW